MKILSSSLYQRVSESNHFIGQKACFYSCTVSQTLIFLIRFESLYIHIRSSNTKVHRQMDSNLTERHESCDDYNCVLEYTRILIKTKRCARFICRFRFAVSVMIVCCSWVLPFQYPNDDLYVEKKNDQVFNVNKDVKGKQVKKRVK